MAPKIALTLISPLFIFAGCSTATTLLVDTPEGWSVSKDSHEGRVHAKKYVSELGNLRVRASCLPANGLTTPDIVVGRTLSATRDLAGWTVVEVGQAGDEVGVTMAYSQQGTELLYARFLAKYAPSGRTRLLVVSGTWMAEDNAAVRPALDAFVASLDCR